MAVENRYPECYKTSQGIIIRDKRYLLFQSDLYCFKEFYTLNDLNDLKRFKTVENALRFAMVC